MEALGALVEQEVGEEVEVLVGGVVAEVATETAMGTITPIQVDGVALQGSVDGVVMVGQMDQMESDHFHTRHHDSLIGFENAIING